MIKIKRKKGFFSISAVAKMFSVHQQTIRLYEKQGLVTPERSAGNTRLFSEEDIDRLEEVIYLTHELGINLAGVEMILKLKKQMKKMQKEMNGLFDDTQKELDKEVETAKNNMQTTGQRLLKIKQEHHMIPTPKTEKNSPSAPHDDAIIDTQWEIEYED